MISVVPEVPLLWVVTVSSRSFLLAFPSKTDRQVQKRDSQKTGRAPGTLEMLRLLLPLLWTGEWLRGRGRAGPGAGAEVATEPLCPPGSLQKDLEYKLQVQELVTVQEGLCVFVPCAVSYPWADWQDPTPAHGYWFQKKHNAKKDILVATNNQIEKVLKKLKPRFDLLGDPGAKNCSLSITDAQKRDSGKYYFQLERGHVNHTYQNDLLTVDVTGMEWFPGVDNRDGRPCVLRGSVQGWSASLRGTHGGPSGSVSPSLQR